MIITPDPGAVAEKAKEKHVPHVPHIREIAWAARQALMPGKLSEAQAQQLEKAITHLVRCDRKIEAKCGTLEDAAFAVFKLYNRGSIGTVEAEKLIVGLQLIVELSKGAPSKYATSLAATEAIKLACKCKSDAKSRPTAEAVEAIGDAVAYLYHGPQVVESAPKKKAAKKKTK